MVCLSGIYDVYFKTCEGQKESNEKRKGQTLVYINKIQNKYIKCVYAGGEKMLQFSMYCATGKGGILSDLCASSSSSLRKNKEN